MILRYSRLLCQLPARVMTVHASRIATSHLINGERSAVVSAGPVAAASNTQDLTSQQLPLHAQSPWIYELPPGVHSPAAEAFGCVRQQAVACPTIMWKTAQMEEPSLRAGHKLPPSIWRNRPSPIKVEASLIVSPIGGQNLTELVAIQSVICVLSRIA